MKTWAKIVCNCIGHVPSDAGGYTPGALCLRCGDFIRRANDLTIVCETTFPMPATKPPRRSAQLPPEVLQAMDLLRWTEEIAKKARPDEEPSEEVQAIEADAMAVIYHHARRLRAEAIGTITDVPGPTP
jgi:hypothetical protein